MRDEWKSELVPATLQRLSPALRRLLLDGQYAKAWKSLGLPDEPYISVSSLDAMVGDIDRSHILVAFAPPSPTIGAFVRDAGQTIIATQPGARKDIFVVLLLGGDHLLGPLLAAVPSAPRGPTRASGQMHSLAIDLIEPLGSRRVIDTRTGRVLERPPAPVDPPQPGGPGT